VDITNLFKERPKDSIKGRQEIRREARSSTENVENAGKAESIPQYTKCIMRMEMFQSATQELELVNFGLQNSVDGRNITNGGSQESGI
jgi:hypothetical protein